MVFSVKKLYGCFSNLETVSNSDCRLRCVLEIKVPFLRIVQSLKENSLFLMILSSRGYMTFDDIKTLIFLLKLFPYPLPLFELHLKIHVEHPEEVEYQCPNRQIVEILIEKVPESNPSHSVNGLMPKKIS